MALLAPRARATDADERARPARCSATTPTSPASSTGSRPPASPSAGPHRADRRVKTVALTAHGRAVREPRSGAARASAPPELARLSEADAAQLRDILRDER